MPAYATDCPQSLLLLQSEPSGMGIQLMIEALLLQGWTRCAGTEWEVWAVVPWPCRSARLAGRMSPICLPACAQAHLRGCVDAGSYLTTLLGQACQLQVLLLQCLPEVPNCSLQLCLGALPSAACQQVCWHRDGRNLLGTLHSWPPPPT